MLDTRSNTRTLASRDGLWIILNCYNGLAKSCVHGRQACACACVECGWVSLRIAVSSFFPRDRVGGRKGASLASACPCKFPHEGILFYWAVPLPPIGYALSIHSILYKQAPQYYMHMPTICIPAIAVRKLSQWWLADLHVCVNFLLQRAAVQTCEFFACLFQHWISRTCIARVDAWCVYIHYMLLHASCRNLIKSNWPVATRANIV